MAGNLANTFQEIESGTKDDWPELQKALRECRLTGAILLIAKLDRLSRNRRFLMDLQESSITFVCYDMSEANNFTVGILACMAEYERELISTQTKEALKAAKARGVVLGNPKLDLVRNTDTRNTTKALVAKAKSRNLELKQIVDEIQEDSNEQLSLRGLASKLNEAGIRQLEAENFMLHLSIES